MTPIPEKMPEPAEIVDVVYALRQRVEQLEETVHDLLTSHDEHLENIATIAGILSKITTILESR